MSSIEFDPILDGLADTYRLASWLVAHHAKLDVSQAQGLAATRLVVEDSKRTGQWCIPLSGALDMVDLDDGWFATDGPADIRVTGMADDTPARVEVLYTGIDDQLRRSTVDPTAKVTFEPVQQIPNN